MVINKSQGFTKTEKLLADLCEETFLKAWTYPNPFKADGKELCDVIAVFENNVFLFFDRESRKFDDTDGDIMQQWLRWEKEVIQKQIKTAEGAKKYVLRYPDKIFLDKKASIPLPVKIPEGTVHVHKIIVAHGAMEACKNFSKENISGSLAVLYGTHDIPLPVQPFALKMDRKDPVHVFDSQNLQIVLNELDTFHDFKEYLVQKENAIGQLENLFYCGEEDLLGHYFQNFDSKTGKHFIGVDDDKTNTVWVAEGTWEGFIRSGPYQRRNEANKGSYFWDRLLQITTQNALDDKLKGNGNIFSGESAVHEMAKEPRFSRRILSERMQSAIESVPDTESGLFRNVSLMSSFYSKTAYVFLQLRHPGKDNYPEDIYRGKRQVMLEIACGVAKNKYPQFTKIIGIGMDAPKFAKTNGEDFILLTCENWSADDALYYSDQNKGLKFFETDTLQKHVIRYNDFPDSKDITRTAKIGRNEKCPCKSGKKYKYCCGKS